MANVDLSSARLLSSDDPRFAELIAIYREAHPASERKSSATLAEMVVHPGYIFLVAMLDGTVIGFAIVLCFTGTDACLLEYMAISQALRGRGIGQFLFKRVIGCQEVIPRFLLAEVDSDKLPSPDRIDRTRRKVFYRRLGCRELEGLRYLMPPVSESTPPAMDMLVYKPNLPPSIDRSKVAEWLQCSYVEVYARDRDDPGIAAMLAELPEKVRLL